MAFFKPASRKKVRGRIAFDGPAGSGKTFTALRLAHCLGSKIAVINTESGAVEKYLGLAPDGIPWKFDVGYLQDNSPTSYTAAMLEAARAGYEVLIIDSFSHAWAGAGGALELVDKKGGAKFSSGWRDVTPMHNRMIEAVLGSPCHIISTLRTKTEYVVEEYTDNNGQRKSAPRRIGMKPIQRDGVEYEFDVVCDLDLTNTLTVTKTRCSALRGQVCVMPGAEFFAPLVEWLNEGEDPDPSAFIATEEDLRRSEQARLKRELEQKKLERQQEAAAKAAEKAEQPKEDVKEVMRRKAAERAAAAEQSEQDDATPGDNGSAAVAAAADGEANIPDANSEAVAAGPEGENGEEQQDAERSSADQPPFSNGSDSADSIDAIVARIEKYGPLSFGDKWGEIRSATLKRRGVGRFKSLPRDALEEICEKAMAPAMGLEQANADVKARQQGQPATAKN